MSTRTEVEEFLRLNPPGTIVKLSKSYRSDHRQCTGHIIGMSDHERLGSYVEVIWDIENSQGQSDGGYSPLNLEVVSSAADKYLELFL